MEPITRRTALALGAGTLLGRRGVTAGADSADAATHWQRLVVVTANIGRNNKSQREQAIRDVLRASVPEHLRVG